MFSEKKTILKTLGDTFVRMFSIPNHAVGNGRCKQKTAGFVAVDEQNGRVMATH